jgi:tetratricopeptide (TPR) repeat protein
VALGLTLAFAPAIARAQSGPAPTAAPATSSEAPPEPTPEELAEAKHSFESGMKFFNQGNYEAARTQFDAAYKLSRFPALLYNLARTADKQNQRRDSIRYYEQYLATNPPDGPDVVIKLRELRKAEGISEAPQTGAQPQAAASKWLVGTQKLPPIPAMALAGTGAAFLLIGIGCGAGALSASNQLEGANGQMFRGQNADAASRGRALNNAAITFDVLGSLFLAGGGAWIGYWLYMKSNKPSSLPTALRLIPGPGGIGIAGTF